MLLTFLSITFTKLSSLAMMLEMFIDTTCATSKMTLRSTLVFYVTRKRSASAMIIYHYSTSPGSTPGIVIYIFTIGKDRQLEYIDNLYYDGEINHDQLLLITKVSQEINTYE
jgi:hypothetical protein